MTELGLLVKVTAVLVAALTTTAALRHTRASVRALLLASAFGIVLALPVAPLAVPERRIEVALPHAAPAFVDLEPAVVQPAEPASFVAPPTSTQRPLPSIGSIVRVIWGLGALALLLRLGLAFARLRTIRRSGLPWPAGDELLQRLGAPRRVEVFVHEELPAPMTFGAWRPAVGLPAEASSWPASSRHHALLHELAHVRRHDWIVHILAHVACALYWFHPLAWIAARRLCLEAERACDDAVLIESEGTTYAEQLVTLARRLPARGPVAVLSMAARSDLSTRVRAILDARQARGPAGVVWTMAAVVFLIAATMLIGPLRAVERGPEENDVFLGGSQPPASAQAAAAGRGAPPSGLPMGLEAMTDSPTTGPDAPRFEVASIKRNVSGGTTNGALISAGGQFRATNSSLARLIQVAYGLRPGDAIVGGPDWASRDGYDVDARPMGAVNVAQSRLMIRTLLADRFGLVVRREPRDTPVYALTVARSDGRLGPQMARPSGECVMIPPFAQPGKPDAPIVPVSQPPPGQPGRRCGMGRDSGVATAGSTAITGLIMLIAPLVDRPVTDRTGLTGVFDFDLRFTETVRQLSSPDAADPRNDAPSIFTALQEQLGLKLEPARGSVPVLVIDRAERPTANDAPQAAATPAFEVVSIRQNPSGTGAPTTRIAGGRFVATNVPLQQLISDAYRMPIVGGPDWIRSARGPRRAGDVRFDVTATIPAGLSAVQVPAMLQAMLAQRFGLAVHRETREEPAYILVHARDDKRLGAQLTPSTQQCTTEIDGGPLRAPVGRVTEDGKPLCSIMMGPARIRGGGLTLRFLANALGGYAGRPVIDRTGLEGPFDFDLQYAPAGRGLPPDDNRPSIFTAIQEQLGLELRPAVEPIEMLVVDRVSMPTEN